MTANIVDAISNSSKIMVGKQFVDCRNKSLGCSRKFSTTYGMKVHLRSCVSSRSSQFRRITSNSLNISQIVPVSNNKRLECDKFAFGQGNEEEECMNICETANSLLASLNFELLDKEPTNESNLNCPTRLSNLLMLKLGRIGRKTSQRDVDEVIGVLRNPQFLLKNFVSQCNGYRDCAKQEENEMNVGIRRHGFRKLTVTEPTTNVICDVYLRSPTDVVREQIRNASRSSTFFHPFEDDGDGHYCHPMMAEIGRDVVSAVRKEIISCGRDEVIWHGPLTSSETSFVGLLQLYSDKSQTSLKGSAFQFYPLHMTLLNFSEEYRRECIANGSTFLAFLPLSYYKYEEDGRCDVHLNRQQKVKMLHYVIGTILQEITDCGYEGFSCVDKDKVYRRCHPCLVSYVSDLPEAKDLLSVKNGNSSERNCHRCLTLTTEFNKYKIGIARRGKDTASFIQQAKLLLSQGKKKDAELLLQKYSISDQTPSLLMLPFFGIHKPLELNCSFSFEPLHGFHLGISRELKKCLSERLKSQVHFTSSIPTKSGNDRKVTFKQVRMPVLNGVNDMLAYVEEHNPAKGLKIDYSSGSSGESGNGLYLSDGKLIGMLEANNYRSIDMVFPFIGMFLDRCCEEHKDATSTSVFVLYVDIMEWSMSYQGSVLWNNEEVQRLEKMIEKFKEKATDLYSQYQPSKLCTEKYHMLDHIGEDIRRMGGLRYGDSGLFEHMHAKVKQAYRYGSKRKEFAMDETLMLFMKEMSYAKVQKIIESHESSEDISSSSAPFSAQKESMKQDCAVLVRKGKTFGIMELQSARALARKVRKAREKNDGDSLKLNSDKMKSLNQTAVEVLQDVTEDGCRILQKQLHEKCKEIEKVGDSSSSHQRISRVLSGYVPGIDTPTLNDYDSRRNVVRVQKSTRRQSQRMVAGRGFYRTSKLRQDCVLIQGEDIRDTSKINIWVAKLLALLRIEKDSDTNSDERQRNEYLFVQYFDIVPPMDRIDKELGCIRLRWARTSPNSSNAAQGTNIDPVCRWFDLLPVASVRGRVHVIRGDFGINGLGVTQEIEEVPWYDEFFYINRFYFNSDETYYTREKG